MLIRAAADLHGELPEVEPCDLLVLAGDLVPLEVQTPTAAALPWLDTGFREWLEAVPAEHVVGIAGNHDFWALEHDPPAGLRWTYLRDSEATVGGLRIYGTPWTPTFGGWAFEATRSQRRAVYCLIPEGLDLLISHGPPYGCGDWTLVIPPGKGRGREPEHHGCSELLLAIGRAKPRAVVFGHVHEQGGWRSQLGDTLLLNAAVLNERYMPARAPLAFEL